HRSFIFQKKFFWFGTEPVESKALTSYLRGEKQQDLANKNVAWSASTGKGLLYFSKKATDKATPAGIFNLSEVSDISEDGPVSFVFHLGGHKHIFEASTLAERDNWVSVLKAKSAEAKELAPTVTESEEYKKAHADLLPKAPVVAAAATPKEVKEETKAEKAEEKKEAKEEKKEEKKEVKEEKKEARKSRSASRKRTSIFGNFNLGGKKEEKTEAPKEDAVVAPTEEATTAAPVEPVAAPETTEAAPVVAEATPASPTEKPAPTKRGSIFGNLKFGQNKEKKTEAEAPAVPAKDAEPVSETAPVIPAVEASEPLATSVASPATVPTETTEAPVTNGETKATEVPTTKSDKRKSSLPFFTKKEKVASDEEGEKVEKPKSPSPFAKLRGTLKSKTSPKAEKAAEKPAEPAAEAPAASEPTPAPEPVVSEPEPVVPTSTPQVTASA
ncbi:uncharacterized protein LY89DRAFT_572608, partial [Mollisia scopiformis]